MRYDPKNDREWAKWSVIRVARPKQPWECPDCKAKVEYSRYAPFCAKCQRHMEPR